MKFIKVYSNYYNFHYDGWFMVLTCDNNIPVEEIDRFRKNLASQILKEEIHAPVGKEDLYKGKFETFLKSTYYTNYMIEHPDDTILLRENGSWMVYNELTHIITDVCYTDDYNFPVRLNADIVICENDVVAEPFWMKYLEGEYPTKSIVTITNFFNRSIDEIVNCITKAEIISFTTTFTSTDWFLKLLAALDEIEMRKPILVNCAGGIEQWNDICSEFKLPTHHEFIYVDVEPSFWVESETSNVNVNVNHVLNT